MSKKPSEGLLRGLSILREEIRKAKKAAEKIAKEKLPKLYVDNIKGEQ